MEILLTVHLNFCCNLFIIRSLYVPVSRRVQPKINKQTKCIRYAHINLFTKSVTFRWDNPIIFYLCVIAMRDLLFKQKKHII